MSDKVIQINIHFDGRDEDAARSLVGNMIVEAEDMVEQYLTDVAIVRYVSEEDGSHHLQLVPNDVEEEDDE